MNGITVITSTSMHANHHHYHQFNTGHIKYITISYALQAEQLKPTKPTNTATQQYSLRRRPHDSQIPDHIGHLADKKFLIRMLFKDSY